MLQVFIYEVLSTLCIYCNSSWVLYLWMYYIFGKMQIAYRKRYEFAFMFWNISFEWQKLQVIHGYNVGCLVVTECTCFVYDDIIIYPLSGCFSSHYHHPTEIETRLCFKLFFLGNDIPKNKREERRRRKEPITGLSHDLYLSYQVGMYARSLHLECVLWQDPCPFVAYRWWLNYRRSRFSSEEG